MFSKTVNNSRTVNKNNNNFGIGPYIHTIYTESRDMHNPPKNITGCQVLRTDKNCYLKFTLRYSLFVRIGCQADRMYTS